MSIEIRQLKVVSRVESAGVDGQGGDDTKVKLEKLKDEILEECEKLIVKVLSETGER